MSDKKKNKCTCKRKGLKPGEHFITCPEILTPELLAIMGLK